MDKPIRVVVMPTGRSRMRDIETATNGVATTDSDTDPNWDSDDRS